MLPTNTKGYSLVCKNIPNHLYLWGSSKQEVKYPIELVRILILRAASADLLFGIGYIFF